MVSVSAFVGELASKTTGALSNVTVRLVTPAGMVRLSSVARGSLLSKPTVVTWAPMMVTGAVKSLGATVVTSTVVPAVAVSVVAPAPCA